MDLASIKNASRVLNALTHPRMFEDLRRAASLDAKELQALLKKLQKLGYVDKNDSGLWVRLED